MAAQVVDVEHTLVSHVAPHPLLSFLLWGARQPAGRPIARVEENNNKIGCKIKFHLLRVGTPRLFWIWGGRGASVYPQQRRRTIAGVIAPHQSCWSRGQDNNKSWGMDCYSVSCLLPLLTELNDGATDYYTAIWRRKNLQGAQMFNCVLSVASL